MAKPKYEIDRSGLDEIGRSPEMVGALREASQAGLRFIHQQDPTGRYEAKAVEVTAGRSHELRAAIEIEEVEPSWEGAHKRVLVRAVPRIEGF